MAFIHMLATVLGNFTDSISFYPRYNPIGAFFTGKEI